MRSLEKHQVPFLEPKLVQKSKPELVPNICFSKGRTKVEQKLEPVLVPKLEPRFCFWSKKMNHENKKHKKKRCVFFFVFGWLICAACAIHWQMLCGSTWIRLSSFQNHLLWKSGPKHVWVFLTGFKISCSENVGLKILFCLQQQQQ